jgi:hypothetical protein
MRAIIKTNFFVVRSKKYDVYSVKNIERFSGENFLKKNFACVYGLNFIITSIGKRKKKGVSTFLSFIKGMDNMNKFRFLIALF